jgi:twinkle protein
MSVYQSTGIPSLSLPQGANSLPDAILPYLDQFEKVILWMDNDEAGRLNIDKFAAKLGVSRTHIVINN